MSRVSVRISRGTREKLARFVRLRGLSTSAVVEQALLAFIEDCEMLMPPPPLLLSADAFDRVMKMLWNPPQPTRALRSLMRGGA